MDLDQLNTLLFQLIQIIVYNYCIYYGFPIICLRGFHFVHDFFIILDEIMQVETELRKAKP